MTRAQRDYLAVCYHEAGHYTTARGVGIEPEGCRVSETGGKTFLRRDPGAHTPAGRRRLLAVQFGGLLAERFKFGEAPLERAHGHKKDNETATGLLLTFPRAERAREQREAMDLAARALRERWPFVQALAEELQEHGRWGVPA
jgi:hypothetical protein